MLYKEGLFYKCYNEDASAKSSTITNSKHNAFSFIIHLVCFYLEIKAF